MTERNQGEIEVGVTWPSDTFEATQLVNHFVFTDDGQGVYLAFGHVSPPVQMPDELPLTNIEATPRAVLFMTHDNAIQLALALQRYTVEKSQSAESEQ
ncbi:UNVERIFIED_ORG: hypothetical protein M2328_005814 [Rhodococcus erythropolis]